MKELILEQLVGMSHYLGDPGRTYAILGEGNTSARIDAGTFFVKASGFTLGSIDAEGFVAVSTAHVLRALDDESAGDEEVTQALKAALVEPDEDRRPSVETLLHALLLSYPEVNFVGHTHPTFTSMILCSNRAEELLSERACPDQIVVMGHKSLFVPYVDPGLVLARELRKRLDGYVRDEGQLPKAIMLQNHGLISLGKSPKDVTNITDMAEKASQILIGACIAGGPRFMTTRDVDRIHTRPDEKYRQKVIGK